jgi:hypothetical protein
VKSDHGEDTARKLGAEYVRFNRAAREAHAAGDTETARRLMQDAQAAAARVVTRVFGPPAVERVISHVGTGLEKLNARIAAAEAQGRDVTRAKEVAQKAQRLYAAARAEARSDRMLAALIHATQAADLLASMAHR